MAHQRIEDINYYVRDENQETRVMGVGTKQVLDISSKNYKIAALFDKLSEIYQTREFKRFLSKNRDEFDHGITKFFEDMNDYWRNSHPVLEDKNSYIPCGFYGAIIGAFKDVARKKGRLPEEAHEFREGLFEVRELIKIEALAIISQSQK